MNQESKTLDNEFTEDEFIENKFIEDDDFIEYSEFAEDTFADNELAEDTFASMTTENSDEIAKEFAEDTFYKEAADDFVQTQTVLEKEIFENFNIDYEEIKDDYLEDEDDMLMLQSSGVLEDLTNAGFVVTNSMGKEVIDKLMTYKDDCEKVEKEPDSFIEYFYSRLMSTLNILGSTSATFVKQASTMPEFTSTLITAVSRNEINLQSMIISQIHQQIFDLISAGVPVQEITEESIDSSEIIKQVQMRCNMMPALNFTEHLEQILSFLETTIPAALNLYQIESASGAAEDLRRKSTAHNLLKSDFDNIRMLFNGKLQFIKNMKVDVDENLYVKCSTCGKWHKIEKSPMNVVFFPTEKKSSYEIFPEPVKCECGDIIVFSTIVYLEVLLSFLNNSTADLKNFLAISKNLCKGASFLRIKPSLQNLTQTLDYLITPLDDNAEDILNENKLIGKSSIKEDKTIINNTEYREAVDTFYEHLKGFASKQHRDGIKIKNTIYEETVSDENDSLYENQSMIVEHIIPLSTLASYVAHCVGKKYSEEKLLALFSLITYIKEDPVLNDVLDYSNIASIKNKIKIIKDARGNFNTMKEDEYLEFFTIAVNNFPDEVSKLSLEDKNVLRNFLHSNVEKLEDMYIEKDSQYMQVLEDLKMSIFPLSFCKIINFQVFPLSEIVSIINNRCLFTIFSEICDRMIINNYADEFYTYWRSLGIISKQKLSAPLELKSSQTEIWKLLSDMLADFLSDLEVSSRYLDNLYLCVDVQSNTRKLISEIYQELKKCNFYRFCSKLLSFGCDVDLYYDKDFNDSFRKTLKEHYEIAKGVCQVSEYEYYLQNMFSAQELKDNSELFDSLIFGRYILKRKNNESPEDYVERFKNVNPDTEHSKLEWIDNLQEFNCLKGIVHYAAASALATQEYSNYRAATFMAVLFYIISDFTASSKKAAQKLGLTEFYLNVINSTLKLWHYEDFVLYNNCELIQAFEGYYFSSINEILPELQTEFSQILIKPNVDVENIKELFNVADKFKQIFDKAQKIIQADDSLVDTLEESLNEIESFTSEDFMKEVNIVL